MAPKGKGKQTKRESGNPTTAEQSPDKLRRKSAKHEAPLPHNSPEEEEGSSPKMASAIESPHALTRPSPPPVVLPRGPLELILTDPDKPVQHEIEPEEPELDPLDWIASESPLVCTMPEADGADSRQCKVKLSHGIHVSPCLKQDNQKFSTTDYATVAGMFVPPKMVHPLGAQVSNFVRHREFTDYLRQSGVLKLFGSCILSVYHGTPDSWPEPEALIDRLLVLMGRPPTSNILIDELTKQKDSLERKINELTQDQLRILESLDQLQSKCACYELLDQDEILLPRPENSRINLAAMREVFTSATFQKMSAGRDEERTCDELKLPTKKQPPQMPALEIPGHDMRMLL